MHRGRGTGVSLSDFCALGEIAERWSLTLKRRRGRRYMIDSDRCRGDIIEGLINLEIRSVDQLLFLCTEWLK